MKLKILKDYDALSQAAADEILLMIQRKPDAVLCLAAGDSLRGAYARLAQSVQTTATDVSACTFIALDEWVGIPPTREGSCYRYLEENLFRPLQINENQIHAFDAMSDDLDAECIKMNKAITTRGGIDLMVAGVGMNGHIGFNEPGVADDLYAHVAELDQVTTAVGQKYFKRPTNLQQGITLGLKHLEESRMVILVAHGAKKAEVMRLALQTPVSTQVPATLIRKHENALILLDEEAASLLKSGMRLTGLKGQGGIL